MRLGFAVRILGKRGLRAYDSRRLTQMPHLSVSLAHLRDVFAYLQSINVTLYRMAAELAPYATHPDFPQFHRQVDQCLDELAVLGQLARRQGLRLTFHAPLHVQLAAEHAERARQSAQTLGVLAALLDCMDLDDDAVIVVHVGGVYGNTDATIMRWVESFERLPLPVRRRLALEHEHDGASLGVVLRIHAATGVPVVFDHLHFCLNNPERWSLVEALEAALATWPYSRAPKLHFSSPRTELQAIERLEAGRRRWVLRPPRPGHHADLINVWEFAHLVRTAQALRAFDIMLEAKASDVALIRLRHDLQRYVPDVAAWLNPGAHNP